MATDATVGLNETTTPTKFIDNELYTNSFSQVTYRQRVSDVDSRAVLSSILTAVQGATPAGSNVIGAVTQSGTWTVTASGTVAISGTVPISASSLPLPTGASADSTLTGGSQKTQVVNGANVLAVDASGAIPIQAGGTPASTAPTRAVQVGGTDGANLRALLTDSGGRAVVNVNSLPALAAGSAVIGHVIVDSGTVTAANASVSGTGSAIPASATMNGVSDGTTLRAMSGDASGRPNVNINGTVPISAASLPLPTGAALDATLTGGTQQTKITDGTNVAGVFAGTSQNSLTTVGGFITSAYSVSSVSATAWIDLGNLRSVSVHNITNGTSSTATFQGSNDGVNPVTIVLNSSQSTGGTLPASNVAAAGQIWSGTVPCRYFRLNVTGISAGTTSGVIFASAAPVTPVTTNSVNATQSGTFTVTPANTANTTPWLVEVRPQRGTLTDKSGTITAGNTAQTLAAVNSTRKYLFIQNISAADLWINFTTTAVLSQPSIKLAAGDKFIMENAAVSTELVSIIGATTGQAFTAKES